MAGGAVGAAVAPPVDRERRPHNFLGCSVGPRCRSAISQENLGGVIVDLDVAFVDLGEWVWPVFSLDQAKFSPWLENRSRAAGRDLQVPRCSSSS